MILDVRLLRISLRAMTAAIEQRLDGPMALKRLTQEEGFLLKC